MEQILEYAVIVHIISTLSFFMLLIAASQFSHQDPLIRSIFNFTGISIFYSAYHLFNLKEDDPRAIELEVFKKVGVFTLISGSISIILIIFSN